MKKIFSFLLITLLLLGIFGCSKREEKKTPELMKGEYFHETQIDEEKIRFLVTNRIYTQENFEKRIIDTQTNVIVSILDEKTGIDSVYVQTYHGMNSPIDTEEKGTALSHMVYDFVEKNYDTYIEKIDELYLILDEWVKQIKQK